MPGPQGSGGPPGRKGPGRLRRLLTQLGQANPVGTGNTAEYQWGTHAVATHVAEALKSSVFRSLAAALPAAVPLFIFAAQQAFALPSTNFITAPSTGATPQPIALTKGAPQYVDLTLQASLSAPLCLAQGPTVRAFVGGPLPVDLTPPPQSFEPLAASQGRVPPLTAGVPQQDPTQLAAFFTPAQPAAPTVPGILAAFCSAPPQIEDRQMQIVWPAIMLGITPTPTPTPADAPSGSGGTSLTYDEWLARHPWLRDVELRPNWYAYPPEKKKLRKQIVAVAKERKAVERRLSFVKDRSELDKFLEILNTLQERYNALQELYRAGLAVWQQARAAEAEEEAEFMEHLINLL